MIAKLVKEELKFLDKNLESIQILYKLLKKIYNKIFPPTQQTKNRKIDLKANIIKILL